MDAISARFQPRRIVADGDSIGDPLAENLQMEIGKAGDREGWRSGRLEIGKALGQRAGTLKQSTFGAESKTNPIGKMTLGLSERAMQSPAHRAMQSPAHRAPPSELRGFEHGAGGKARSGAHDDVGMALPLECG